MVQVIETSHLFLAQSKRDTEVIHLLQPHFEHISAAQILYELKRYGLNTSASPLPFDESWWSTLATWAKTLQSQWDGPQASIYVLPAKRLNAACFQHCICLFLTLPLDEERLRSMLTHEYNHSCRLNHLGLPESVKDYIVFEGLAQWAVRSLHGEEALDSWATKLSLEQAFDIWSKLNLDDILDVYAVLFGEEIASIPEHFGYTLGYRIVEQFVKEHPTSLAELLTLPTEVIWP